jgi:hypothetical protein
MRHVRPRRLPIKVALGMLATVGVICGTAYATVLAPSSTAIHACASVSNGSLRSVGDAGKCLKGERPLSWNVAGPQGSKGRDGAQGAAGPAGPAGPQGQTGAAGAKGQTGAAGEAGAAGPQGQTGAAGPQGQTGAAGPQGQTGAAGPQGQTGDVGPQGSGANAVLGLEYPSAAFSNPARSIYGASPPSGINFGQVPCSTGKKILGGGVLPFSANQTLKESYRTNGTSAAPGETGWGATVVNSGATDQSFTVFAICANQ